MPKPQRAPMSQLEKFTEGLILLRKFQPAGEMRRVGGYLLVGTLEDAHLPEGMKAKMGEYGFQIEETRKAFAYKLPEPRQPQRS